MKERRAQARNRRLKQMPVRIVSPAQKVNGTILRVKRKREEDLCDSFVVEQRPTKRTLTEALANFSLSNNDKGKDSATKKILAEPRQLFRYIGSSESATALPHELEDRVARRKRMSAVFNREHVPGFKRGDPMDYRRQSHQKDRRMSKVSRLNSLRQIDVKDVEGVKVLELTKEKKEGVTCTAITLHSSPRKFSFAPSDTDVPKPTKRSSLVCNGIQLVAESSSGGKEVIEWPSDDECEYDYYQVDNSVDRDTLLRHQNVIRLVSEHGFGSDSDEFAASGGVLSDRESYDSDDSQNRNFDYGSTPSHSDESSLSDSDKSDDSGYGNPTPALEGYAGSYFARRFVK